MATFIIKIDDWYFEYSSIVAAFVLGPCTRDQYERYYRDEHGAAGVRELPARLERVDRTGTSAYGDTSAWNTLCCNRMLCFEPFKDLPPRFRTEDGDTYRDYTATWDEIVQAVRDGSFD